MSPWTPNYHRSTRQRRRKNLCSTSSKQRWWKSTFSTQERGKKEAGQCSASKVWQTERLQLITLCQAAILPNSGLRRCPFPQSNDSPRGQCRLVTLSSQTTSVKDQMKDNASCCCVDRPPSISKTEEIQSVAITDNILKRSEASIMVVDDTEESCAMGWPLSLKMSCATSPRLHFYVSPKQPTIMGAMVGT